MQSEIRQIGSAPLLHREKGPKAMFSTLVVVPLTAYTVGWSMHAMCATVQDTCLLNRRQKRIRELEMENAELRKLLNPSKSNTL
jgi:hypothetical protein